MANVIFTPPVPVAGRRWDPGTDEDWILGPADAYRNSTITVTAHAHEPVLVGRHRIRKVCKPFPATQYRFRVGGELIGGEIPTNVYRGSLRSGYKRRNSD